MYEASGFQSQQSSADVTAGRRLHIRTMNLGRSSCDRKIIGIGRRCLRLARGPELPVLEDSVTVASGCQHHNSQRELSRLQLGKTVHQRHETMVKDCVYGCIQLPALRTQHRKALVTTCCTTARGKGCTLSAFASKNPPLKTAKAMLHYMPNTIPRRYSRTKTPRLRQQ